MRRKTALFSKIETRGDALGAIRDCSALLLITTAILTLQVILYPNSLHRPVLFGALCYLLFNWKQRAAAVLALVASIFVGIPAFFEIWSDSHSRGKVYSLFFALLLVFATSRAVEATFKLHRKFAPQDDDS